jgi:phosphoribosylanthranilate isomerase
MTRVKICGITRTEDAAAAARAGADAIGLVFYEKSPRNVSLDQAHAVLGSLPPFVTSVALFVNPSIEDVQSVLRALPIDLLQFHGDESRDFCRSFARPYVKAVRVKPGVDLVRYAAAYPDARGLLLDAHVEGQAGGTGESFDWGLIPKTLALPVVLSGGLHSGNVAEGISRVRPWAVDVSSGVEVAKGIKDGAKIAAFMQGVRDADV